MFLLACGALLLIGLAVNLPDRRALALTALVGAAVFVPVPRESAFQFYSFCMLGEIVVAVSALVSRAPAASAIMNLCVLLIIAHVLGYALDGSPPFSPYRGIVKLLEVTQLAMCIVLSPVLAPLLRNHDATTTG